MSRPWRIEYEGALFLLLLRGNERSDISMDEKDRSEFVEAVGEMSLRFEIDTFAYVLILFQFAGDQVNIKSTLNPGRSSGTFKYSIYQGTSFKPTWSMGEVK